MPIPIPTLNRYLNFLLIYGMFITLKYLYLGTCKIQANSNGRQVESSFLIIKASDRTVSKAVNSLNTVGKKFTLIVNPHKCIEGIHLWCIKGCIEDIINHDAGCNIGLIKCNVLAYADDIVLMAPSLNGLQKLIDTLGESIKKIRLNINAKKSKYIV